MSDFVLHAAVDVQKIRAGFGLRIMPTGQAKLLHVPSDNVGFIVVPGSTQHV